METTVQDEWSSAARNTAAPHPASTPNLGTPSPSTSSPWRRVAVGMGAAAALLLSGCVSIDDDVEGVAERDEPDPEDLAAFYEQELIWEDCEVDMQCAQVEVPLDYEDPHGETIEIQIISSETAPEGSPYLLTNPGGPGSSGYDLVAEQMSFIFTDELTEAYNVVGFDPRGVHRSAPVECLTDEEMDEQRELVAEADEDLEDIAAIEQAIEDSAWLGEQCLENSGEILSHIDTVSATRDMDIIRAALGEDELNYIGFSYGTKLGFTYAELFGENMGRFVLDAVMDVTVSNHEVTMGQAEGFETALANFAEWCVNGSTCPVEGDAEDLVEAVQDLFDEVAEEPVEGSDGRLIPVGVLVNGFILPMYEEESWPYLQMALSEALSEESFDTFQYFADLGAGREPDGTYEWKSQLALRAIHCLDYPVTDDLSMVEEELEALEETSPTFGPYLGHLAISCGEWPVEPVNAPGPVEAENAGEMLLIGTTGDPATPVQWAESMHDHLDTSSLLIYDGEGHGAYRPDNQCVADIVDGYLLEGELFDGEEQC